MKLRLQLGLLLLCTLCLINNNKVFGIISAYTFTQTQTGTYDSLVAPTVLARGASLSSGTYRVNLPFTFNYNNTLSNSIYVSLKGFICFNETSPGNGYWMFANTNAGYTNIVSAFDMNLVGLNANTTLSYTTTGNAPYRKFVIEWKDFGYPNATSLKANFQIALYETTNVITFTYGNVSLVGSGSSLDVQVGLLGTGMSDYRARSGSWQNNFSSTSPSAVITYYSGSNPPRGLCYTYTPPAICSQPNQPTNLNFTSTATSIRVSYTLANPNASGYLIVRTNGRAPLNTMPQNTTVYSAGDLIGNGTVVANTTAASYSNSGLPSNSTYTYTVIPYNSNLCFFAPIYNTTNCLSGDFYTKGPRKYYWTTTSDTASFTDSNSWTPLRTYSDVGDTLIFSNSNPCYITNFPSSLTVSSFVINENANVTFKNPINSSLAITNYLGVKNNATAIFEGNNTFDITPATNARIDIEGSLILKGYCNLNTTNTYTDVYGSVYVSDNAIFNTTCTTNCYRFTRFLENSNYYHQRNGGIIPTAIYHTNSNIYIKNVTTTSPNMTVASYQDRQFGNIYVDCPLLTTTIRIVGSTNVFQYNSLTVNNTGTGSYAINSNTRIVNDVRLLKGNIGTGNLEIGGNLYIDSGRFNSVNTFIAKDVTVRPQGILDGSFTLNGSLLQQVNTSGNIQINSTVQFIRLKNPAGARLTGDINILRGNVYVTEGRWSGTGRFKYLDELSSILVYDANSNIYTSEVEWPSDATRPKYVTINSTGTYPNNKVFLQEDHNDSTGLYLDLNKGILELGDYSLSCRYIHANTLTSPRSFITTNGTGKLYGIFPVGTTYINFAVGDTSNGGFYTAFALTLESNTVKRKIGMQLSNSRNTNIPSTSNYLKRYWEFTDSENAPLTYTAQISYLNSDKLGIGNYPFQIWDGTQWLDYPDLVTYDTSVRFSSSSINNFNVKTFTAFTHDLQSPANIYTWNGSVNSNFQEPNNWTPSRVNLLPNDMLVFENSLVNEVNNIPSQTVGQIQIRNNTRVNAYGMVLTSTTLTNTLSFLSDTDPLTNELSIEEGSALHILGGNKINISFTGQSATALIAGTLDLNLYAKLIATNAIVNVSSTGILSTGAVSSTNMVSPFETTKENLSIHGTYIDNTTRQNAYIPNANWQIGSTVVIGRKAASFTVNGLAQSFYNFTCNTQYDAAWTASYPDSVKGIFTLANNTNRLTMGSNTKPIFINKINIDNGTLSFTGEIYVADTIRKQSGQLTGSTSTTILYLCGNTNRQVLLSNDSIIIRNINVFVSNPYGVHIDTLSPFLSRANANFYINGDLKIGTAASPAITASCPLRYHTTAAQLFYNGPARVADDVVFPNNNGPQRITVQLNDPDAVLEMPFTRTVGGTLTLFNDVKVDNNDLTIGNGPSSLGTITGNGLVWLTTGSLTRWVGTTLPRAVVRTGSNTGRFPIAYEGRDRSVNIMLPTSTSVTVTNPGTVTVRYNHSNTLSSFGPLMDGSQLLNTKIDGNWKFETGNNFTINGSINFAAITDEIFNTHTYTYSNFRLTRSQSLVGTNGNTVDIYPNYSRQRTGLSLADLTDSPFYFSFIDTFYTNALISVQSGDWHDPATWDANRVPTINDRVYVSSFDTVTISNDIFAKLIEVQNHGYLKFLNGNHFISERLNNLGTFHFYNGELRMGTRQVARSSFRSTGNCIMNNGLIMVNGGFQCLGNSYVQNGGRIIVNFLSESTNWASINPVVINCASVNATDGIIQIINPSSDDSSFVGGGFSDNHSLIFGDSISNYYASPGRSNLNFVIDPIGKTLNNVIVNGTAGVTNGRDLVFKSNTNILGNIQLLNTGAKLNMNRFNVYLKGNLQLDTNTLLIANGHLYMSGINGTINNTPQSISGKGNIDTIRTSSLTRGKNLASLTINNASSTTIDVGALKITKTLNLTAGRVNVLNNAALMLIKTATLNSNAANAWVNGRFSAEVDPATLTRVYTYPIGNGNASKYASLTILERDAVGTTGGYITMSNVEGDNPMLNTSLVNPNRTINQQYIIDTTNSAISSLGTGLIKLTTTYHTSDADAGFNYRNASIAKLNNNSWEYLTPSSVNPNQSEFLVSANNMNGVFQIGETSSNPIIIQQPSNQTICESQPIAISLTAQNATGYKWQLNNNAIWEDLVNNNFYNGVSGPTLQISNTPLSFNANNYRCVIYKFNDSLVSNSASLTVTNLLVPQVNINVSSGTSICYGNTSTFTAITNNTSSQVSYSWKVNNIPAGLNQNTFTSNSINHNDVVSCDIYDNSSCASPQFATSNRITMSVRYANLDAQISASNNGSAICEGTPVTFTAAITDGGTTPTYQWKKNGVIVGTNDRIYTDNALNNGDTISCVVIGSDCSASLTTLSNTIVVTVLLVSTPVVIISPRNAPICQGQNARYIATVQNGGLTPVYKWAINGTLTGANADTLNITNPSNNDIVTCTLTSNAQCLTDSVAMSNADTIRIHPFVTPSINITSSDTSICAGSLITFNATATNEGAAPTYQWKVNGSNRGTNSPTFSSATLNNNDVVSCALISNANCLTTPTVLSNTITVTVIPTVNPMIYISASQYEVCDGDNVTFTSSASYAGTNPTYMWKVNGIATGITTSTYTTNSLNNNDLVSCFMTSNERCTIVDTVSSTPIEMRVLPIMNPTVTLTSNPGTNACSGQEIVYTATISDLIGTAYYRWRKNGQVVGGTSTEYRDNTITSSDRITYILYPVNTCNGDSVVSNAVQLAVGNSVIPGVSIVANPGGPIAPGTNVTFTAIPRNEGTNPSYSWRVNGISVGNNSATYSSSTLSHGNTVTVTLTSSLACAQPRTVTSDAVYVEVYPVNTIDLSLIKQINVYPNPAKDKLFINATFNISHKEDITLRVKNQLGQIVLTSNKVQLHNNILDYRLYLPEHLSNGIYILEISVGQYINYKKFMIDK